MTLPKLDRRTANDIRGVAQRIEQRVSNSTVEGSIPFSPASWAEETTVMRELLKGLDNAASNGKVYSAGRTSM